MEPARWAGISTSAVQPGSGGGVLSGDEVGGCLGFGAFGVEFDDDVGVGVAGDGQAGVAEQVLEVFEIATGGFEVGGGAVS
jgi:hypothetical protein